MLRVVTNHDAGGCRLVLHGALSGDWVPVLEEQWRSILGNAGYRPVIVVLMDVDFIDADGERLLQKMADEGAEFEVSGCMNRYVIDNLRARSAT